MSKSVSALEQVPKSAPQRRKLVHMLSEDGEENGSPGVSSSSLAVQHPPPTTGPPQSPSTTSQKMARAKNSVGKFFTHSLRNHRKFKSKSKSSKSLYDSSADPGSNNSLYLPPMSPEEKEASAKLSNLVSPMFAERKITMSTVMHIHYRDARDALLYKSLLVSHKIKARDVVAEALKRFDLTAEDPSDFSLFEVVGRWQDVSQSVENESSLRLGAPPLSMSSASLITAPRPAVTSIEEFVECYSRAVGPSERPYNLQFYLATQEGYTRRFELRRQSNSAIPPRETSRSQQALNVKDNAHNNPLVAPLDVATTKRLSWADTEFCKAGSPLFGDTSHRKKGRRHNQQRSSLGSAVQEGSETEEDILDEVKNRRRVVTAVGDGEEAATGKVGLRGDEVTKSHPDSLLVDEGDPFAPDVSTPRRRKVLLSATSSSPDSGVVSFGKDKKLRHNSEDFSSTRSKSHVESVSMFNDTPTHTSAVSHAQLLKNPFLLNLRMNDTDKEPLVQPLEADSVSIISTGGESFKTEPPTENGSNHHFLRLFHPDFGHDSRPLCSLQLQTNRGYSLDHPGPETSRVYVLHPTHPDFPVHVNGNIVVEPVTLSHGDLLSLYKDHYLFLFQDYSSTNTTQTYSWRPHPTSHLLPSSPLHLSTPLPSSPVIKEARSARTKDQLTVVSPEGEDQKGGVVESTVQNTHLSPPHTLTHSQPAHVTDTSHNTHTRTPTETIDHTDAACQTPTPLQQRRNSGFDDAPLHLDLAAEDSTRQRLRSEGSYYPNHHERHAPTTDSTWFNSLQRPKKSHRSRHHLSSSSSSLPSSPRKSLFSFSPGEEDALLRHLVTDLDTGKTSCQLGPALLLAMCTEYCHKCHGTAAVSKFLQKTVDSVQEVVWVSSPP